MRQSNSDTCCLENKGVVAVEQRWTFDGDDTEALAAFVGHLPGAMMTIPRLLLVGGTLDLASGNYVNNAGVDDCYYHRGSRRPLVL